MKSFLVVTLCLFLAASAYCLGPTAKPTPLAPPAPPDKMPRQIARHEPVAAQGHGRIRNYGSGEEPTPTPCPTPDCTPCPDTGVQPIDGACPTVCPPSECTPCPDGQQPAGGQCPPTPTPPCCTSTDYQLCDNCTGEPGEQYGSCYLGEPPDSCGPNTDCHLYPPTCTGCCVWIEIPSWALVCGRPIIAPWPCRCGLAYTGTQWVLGCE